MSEAERASLQLVLAAVAQAVARIPGGSPWTDTLWDWGSRLERALASHDEEDDIWWGDEP